MAASTFWLRRWYFPWEQAAHTTPLGRFLVTMIVPIDLVYMAVYASIDRKQKAYLKER